MLLAWRQLNDPPHPPALDVVSERGDVDVQVSRGNTLPSVFLLKGLLIVHISLDVICERIFPVFIAKTLGVPLWLQHSWLNGKRSNKKTVFKKSRFLAHSYGNKISI